MRKCWCRSNKKNCITIDQFLDFFFTKKIDIIILKIERKNKKENIPSETMTRPFSSTGAGTNLTSKYEQPFAKAAWAEIGTIASGSTILL